jgi:hypothetical protein
VKTKSQSKFHEGYYFSLTNILVCFSAHELALRHDCTYLPVDEEAVQNDDWYLHPNPAKFPVMVNTAGTHMYNTENDCFVPIRRYKWKLVDWVQHEVSVKGKQESFSRLAVECFTGVELGSLQVDHFNHNRDDNSKDNLSGKGQLFQANNKKCQLPRDDGTHCGVLRRDNAKVKLPHWMVTYSIQTPDGSLR